MLFVGVHSSPQPTGFRHRQSKAKQKTALKFLSRYLIYSLPIPPVVILQQALQQTLQRVEALFVTFHHIFNRAHQFLRVIYVAPVNAYDVTLTR